MRYVILILLFFINSTLGISQVSNCGDPAPTLRTATSISSIYQYYEQIDTGEKVTSAVLYYVKNCPVPIRIKGDKIPAQYVGLCSQPGVQCIFADVKAKTNAGKVIDLIGIELRGGKAIKPTQIYSLAEIPEIRNHPLISRCEITGFSVTAVNSIGNMVVHEYINDTDFKKYHIGALDYRLSSKKVYQYARSKKEKMSRRYKGKPAFNKSLLPCGTVSYEFNIRATIRGNKVREVPTITVNTLPKYRQ
ncbi:MAG: hypothetical protein GY810_05930 [Aureispira sp.]|nr:hypothetical protein [Aureispira sp.]